jgi:NOL1/NOP2/fmu family ribosome biogenesis protein
MSNEVNLFYLGSKFHEWNSGAEVKPPKKPIKVYCLNTRHYWLTWLDKVTGERVWQIHYGAQWNQQTEMSKKYVEQG